MKISSGLVAGSFVVAAMLQLRAAPAFAYGAEGLFGGRPSPDNTIVLGNPIDLKNDRPDRSESVLDHPRPDYDPAPIDVGSFELFPSLELGESYNSNIYAAKSNTKDDAITTARPIVNLFSNWGQHALSMTTFGDVNLYANHEDENFENFVTDWNGRYDIMSQTWLSARGGFQHLAEPRTSPDAVLGSEPTTFDLKKGGLGFYRGIGVLKLNADYDVQRFDYNLTPSASGPIDQSSRDRTEHVFATKLGYDLSANVKPYVKVSYNRHDYDNNSLEQSQGYDAVLGSTFDFGGITSLDIYMGGMSQDFRNFTGAKDVTAPKFGGRLDWNVTGLTSLALEVSRTLEDTTQTDFNSYLATGGSATLTHELRRNILLEGDFSFTRSDYQGLSTRQDDEISTGVGTRYLINRNMYADFLYNWARRYSDSIDSAYIRNLVSVRLGYRL